MPPAGQLLNPESLPLLLESTYAKAGLLVPESNTSGTTPEADMFFGALAGIKFTPPPQSINFCPRLQIASLRNLGNLRNTDNTDKQHQRNLSDGLKVFNVS